MKKVVEYSDRYLNRIGEILAEEPGGLPTYEDLEEWGQTMMEYLFEFAESLEPWLECNGGLEDAIMDMLH